MNIIVAKKCSRCKQTKEWYNFYINEQSKSGLSRICKECFPDYIIERHYKSLQRNKKIRSKEEDRNSHLRTNYNITLEEYNKLFKNQKGKCPICGIHQSKFSKAFCVDHNHTTNKIRGLLCNNCNAGLGFFKDNINSLLGAIEYLNINQ